MIKLNFRYYYIDGDQVDEFSPPSQYVFETYDEACEALRENNLERIAELERELKKLKREVGID